MARSRRWTEARGDDDGSASLEFVSLGVLLLVPLVYLVVALAGIQSAALAAEGAVRQATRMFTDAPVLATAQDRADRAIALALDDHGVAAETATVTVTCAPDPADCLAIRGFVTISIEVLVPLPLLPAVLPGNIPLAVPVQAAATQQVSRFGGAG